MLKAYVTALFLIKTLEFFQNLSAFSLSSKARGLAQNFNLRKFSKDSYSID